MFSDLSSSFSFLKTQRYSAIPVKRKLFPNFFLSSFLYLLVFWLFYCPFLFWEPQLWKSWRNITDQAVNFMIGLCSCRHPARFSRLHTWIRIVVTVCTSSAAPRVFQLNMMYVEVPDAHWCFCSYADIGNSYLWNSTYKKVILTKNLTFIIIVYYTKFQFAKISRTMKKM